MDCGIVARCDKTSAMTPDEFRTIALSMPESDERSHMSHPDFRVNGKIFATLGPDLSWGMVKLTPEQQQYFLQNEPASFKAASGAWGERGATIIDLKYSNEEAVRQAIRSAWRNIAPNNLTLTRIGS